MGFEQDSEEASSPVHLCRGLSGVRLLPALMRNLGVLLTPVALRRVQEAGCVDRYCALLYCTVLCSKS